MASTARTVTRSPLRTPIQEEKDGEIGMGASKPATRRPSTGRRETGGGEGLIADKIAYLQEATETLTKRIEMERRKSDELEKKIKISRGKLEESRARMRGADETTAFRQRTKAVKSAEHRLDVLMARFNTINKHNDTLKGDIESLRRDKLQRQRIMRRLEREVTEARRRLESVASEAASATEARDKAEREISALQATIQREASQFESEFTHRISGFTDAVAQRKRAAENEANNIAQPEDPGSASQAALVRPGIGPVEETHGSMTVEQEIELKHKSIKTLWEIARREVEVKEQSAKLAQLEEAFGKIQESTGIATIDEMVNAFVQTEDRNYAILTMINDLNREIEAAEVENASLRSAVEEARSKGSVGHANRDRLNKDWDSQLASLARRTTMYDKQYESALRSLDAIKPGVHSIFQKVGSSDSAVAESLAAAGVTDGNIMTHLGLIEQRVSELLHMYEMSMQGIPLTLATEEEEAQMAAAGMNVSGGVTASPRATLDVEISRVGGIGSTDGSRQRRAVIAAPIPPSLADLDESDDDVDVFLTMPSVGLVGTPAVDQSATRRASISKARRASTNGKAPEETESDLLEPMSLDELRQHTIALVEKKQAKAEKRERLVEQARIAFLESLPPSTAAALYASGRNTRLSNPDPQPVNAALAVTGGGRPSASASTMRSQAQQYEAGPPPATAGSVRGEPSPPADGGSFVPRPPSQPSVRPAAARPGARNK